MGEAPRPWQGWNQRSSVLLTPSSSFGVPLDSLGVPDGHFQHELWWDLEELGVVAVGLEQQGQDIKAPVWSLPALLDADLQGQ